MKKYFVFLLLLLLLTSCGGKKKNNENSNEGRNRIEKTQTEIMLEAKLVKQMEKLDKLNQNVHPPNADVDSDVDSLAIENNKFKKMLIECNTKYPESIDFSYDEFKKEGLSIVTSEDGNVRAYSWDSGYMGTMKIFYNVFQIKVNEKVYSFYDGEENDQAECAPLYADIKTIKFGDNTFYLLIMHGIAYGTSHYDLIKLCKISGNKLENIKNSFRTKKKNYDNITYGFNPFTAGESSANGSLAKYDDKTKILEIPVVEDEGEVTNKSIIYKFTGEYFEFLSISSKAKVNDNKAI